MVTARGAQARAPAKPGRYWNLELLPGLGRQAACAFRVAVPNGLRPLQEAVSVVHWATWQSWVATASAAHTCTLNLHSTFLGRFGND